MHSAYDMAQLLTTALARPACENVLRSAVPDLAYGRHRGPPSPDARHGAVLILVYPTSNDWRVPLTVRMHTLAAHAGQVSFPGGRIETGETPSAAALREGVEELGIDAHVDILGQLTSLHVFASNFWVTPIVAIARTTPGFTLNPAEVAEQIDLPVLAPLESCQEERREFMRGCVRFCAPSIMLGGHAVWGATYLILREFQARLRAVAKS